jgi:adhesin/invasin
MIKNILYSFIALFLILNITSCGQDSSTSAQANANTTVTIAADKTQAIANGSDGATLTITVKNSNGLPLAQQTIGLNISSILYSYLTPTLTDENGQVIIFVHQLAALNLSNKIIGPTETTYINVVASCNGISSDALSIMFLPVTPTTTTSVTLVADKTQAIANGVDTVTLTATVKDNNGNTIPRQAISFNVPTGMSPFLSLPITDSNGEAVIHLTCPLNTLNDKVIDVTATSGGIISNVVTVTYSVPPPIIPVSVELTADKTQAVADSKDVITITAIAKDGNGLPIPQQPITFNVTPSDVNPFFSAIRSDANGLSVIHLTSPPNSFNDKVMNVTASSGGISSNTVIVTFSALPQVAPALVTLASDKTTLIIDGNDQINFTITATDSNGNPLAGQAYTLNIPSGPYMILFQTMTNTAGQAFSSLHSVIRLPAITSPTVESVTATINGTTSNAISITAAPP